MSKEQKTNNITSLIENFENFFKGSEKETNEIKRNDSESDSIKIISVTDKELNELNKELKEFFEKLPKKSNEIEINVLNVLKIKEVKNNILTNVRSSEIFKDKIRYSYEELIENVEEKEQKANLNSKKAYGMILKMLEKRKERIEKKLEQFTFEENWNEKKKREETYLFLRKYIGNLIDSIKYPLVNGLKSDRSYSELIKDFNNFLEELGIFTYTKAKEGEVPTAEEEAFLTPIDSQDNITNDPEMKNKIKEILFYPYAIHVNEEVLIIADGEAVFYKYESKSIGD